MHSLGIIGCGTHAEHHAENLGKRFYLRGVWDPDPGAMGKFGGVIQHSTLDNLLSDSQLEAVLIASLDRFHLEQIELALRAGKHVLCEKPLISPGQRLRDLDKMFTLARERGLVLTTCYPRRMDWPFIWLQNRINLGQDEEEFASDLRPVVGFDYDFSYHAPSSEWKHSRSLLLDHLCHEIDLLNFLFGPSYYTGWRLHDSPYHYGLCGKRDDGIVFNFRGTRALEADSFHEWCSVRFERAELRLDLMMGLAHISSHEKGTVKTISGHKTDHARRLLGVIGNFASQIERCGTPYVSTQEMLMSTEAGIVFQDDKIHRIDGVVV